MTHTGYRVNKRYGSMYLGAVIILGFFCVAISCKGPESPKLFTVENGVKPPVAEFKPAPSYTEEARKARAEGIVVLQAVIRKDGKVAFLKVLRGLGYGLDESAANTIATKWRFKPGTKNGSPVDVQATIEVSFRLF